jgi:hypothetical protein
MAKTQQQINAAILANRQKNAPMIAERAARAKATGQDLDTVGRQMRDEAHQASLKRLYGNDLDTTNPAAVNAARAAKQAAAAQSRMDARQIRDADFAAKQAAAVQQTAIDDDDYNQSARQVGLDRAAARGAADAARRAQAQAATIARMDAAKAAAPVAAPAAAPAAPMAASTTGFAPMKRGGQVKKMASGGMTSKVSKASSRGDGIAQRGKTKGRMC